MNKGIFDVVVIGSGIGGACAAARLAHGGYKTLLIERLPILGGRTSTIEDRYGFKKTTGAIRVPNVIEATFREVGAEFNVKYAENESVFRIEGQDYLWPKAVGFPNALSLYAKDKDGVARVQEAIGRAILWKIPQGQMTVKEWLSQYTKDERIFQVFNPLCTGWLGACNDMAHISDLIESMSELKKNQWKMGIARKGNIDLIESLANVVRNKGGEVWTEAGAKQIKVDKYKATGVVIQTDKGEWEISAKAVVSNTGPKKTVELAGAEHFDKAYLKELELVQPTPLFIIIDIYSDEPLVEHAGFIWPIGSKLVGLLSPTLDCPDLAPPGKHLTIAMAGMQEFKRPPIDTKKEINAIIQELYRVLPAAKEKGKRLTVSCFQGTWPIYRSAWYKLSQKTPIMNLYNVGDGVRIPGIVATAGCAESARIVSEDIMSRLATTG